jgi:phage shock protein A
MATNFVPISLTLRSTSNPGDTTKGVPLTYAEGDGNLISLKSFSTTAIAAINDLENDFQIVSQQSAAANQAVTVLESNYTILEDRVSDLEDIDSGARLTSLESYIPTITAISSTVSTHTTKINDLETYSLEYFGSISGGSDAANPLILDTLPSFRQKAVYYVSSSGWFGRAGDPSTSFADVGDTIIVDGTYFQTLKTSSFTLNGSGSIEITKSTETSGNVGTDLVIERSWSVDISQTLKDRIQGIEDNADQVPGIETRVSNLETNLNSPFVYRGTVAGGTQVSPFDLTTLTQTSSGDYYRVSSSGYFVDSSLVVHYYNQNDGLVFVGGLPTKIDNTDSVTSGTTDYISVTGNTDEGFVVDIDSAFKQRMTDAESGITGLDGRLDTAEGSISDHETRIGDLETDVGDHETRISTLESTATTLLYATKASGRASFTTTDPDQIVDSFDSTVLKTAKYVIQAELTDGSMHASEILVTNNGIDVFFVEYSKLNNGTDLVTYSADFDGTLVELYATPANANTTITFARTAIKKA